MTPAALESSARPDAQDAPDCPSPNSMDPVAHLLCLRRAAITGTLPRDTGQWLAAAIDALLIDGADPGTAFGLSRGRGHRLAPSDWRQALRDEHLARAAALAGGATPLASAIRRFLGHRWPIWRDRGGAPTQATALERELYEAAVVGGGDLPTSVRHLRRIQRRRT